MSNTQPHPVPENGVFAALASPRRANSVEVDVASLLDYSDALTAAGVTGFVLFGSTGEFVHFDQEERMRVAGLLVRRSRVPLLVNVSHSSLAGALQLAESAIDAGASALLLMPPYFYSYGEAQLGEFYRQFADAMRERIALYLYNIPMCTNELPLELAGRLLASGAFRGIKDSSGGQAYLAGLLALRQQSKFQIFVGSERLFVQARKAGANGAISGVAAVVPELMLALNRAVDAQDEPRIAALHARAVELVDQVDRFPATVVIRQAGMLRGWKLRESAVPFDDDMAADLIAFHTWFREWLPRTLDECGGAEGSRLQAAGGPG